MSTFTAPKRTVGFWGASLLPVNGMIGAGIFALPAVLAGALGSFAPWMMALGGLLFMPLALCYAWLATKFDHSGGPVLYGEAAFGRFLGFQAGWGRYASAIVTSAANTHVMVTYLAALFPVLDGPVATPVAVAVILALTGIINLLGMRGAIGTLGVMTAIKVLPLLALVVSAFFTGNPAIGFVLPEFSQFETVVLLTFYAFMGFETVVEPAGEMRNPKRDLPRAIVAMVAAVTVLYMAVIWAYLAIAPGDDGENALAAAALASMGQAGSVAIVVAAAFSIGANTFGGLTALARLVYGMAERRMLPRWFMAVSPRFGTPANAIIFITVAAILLGFWEGFAVLAIAGTLIRLVTYGICAAALPVIEQREGRVVPLHLAMAIVALASSIWVATHVDARAVTVLVGILLGGALLYAIAARTTPLPQDNAGETETLPHT
ncbi:APC family permease [Alteraurantiacibacter aquimixticola]|uniref:Arginine/agmatine antiporter n=1 Tax=Alteraurantiacibacter aquimixticola TaxID=2489173 RepID=A0A4T3F7P1_9SPHN|nr:APC family permease [Alteraurantiacibacter aquimixticola]TIX51752.1 APC family permease [Alteraurantiacibacter aquimixticola]